MIDWAMFKDFDPIGVAYWEGGRTADDCKVCRRNGENVPPFDLDVWLAACVPAQPVPQPFKRTRRK
jgi:hypothetical protein